jgi:hypothetical protein
VYVVCVFSAERCHLTIPLPCIQYIQDCKRERNRTNPTPVLTASTTQGKALLAANTDQAFADGAFGLPWMVCTNAAGATEGFFGVDHLGQVAEFLGLRKGTGSTGTTTGSGWRALL